MTTKLIKVKINIFVLLILITAIAFLLFNHTVNAAICGNQIWEIGEDVNNCPQDANEYSISPSGEIDVLDTGDFSIGMYIYPDWHNDPYGASLEWKWKSIMNAVPNPIVYGAQEQPKKPIQNYYDDSNPIAVQWMIKWALEHGISLFIYDWYLNNPHTDVPIEAFLSEFNGKYKQYKGKAKFALLWANHNDFAPGTTMNDVLAELDKIEQKYFSLEQYFRIDNQPVFLIFDIYKFLNYFGGSGTNELFSKMKDRMKEKGYGGLYIVVRDSCFINNIGQPLAFDANTTYNYSWMAKMPTDTYDNLITIYNQTWNAVYDKCQTLKNIDGKPISYLLPVTTGWDNTPWKDNYGEFGMYISAIINNTPGKFKTLLENAKSFIQQKGINPKVVIINAWDEWGEGSILAPRKDKWGFGYLQAVKFVFGWFDTTPPAAPTGLIVN